MDDRVTEFVRGLRAAGLRVSVAETVEALDASRAVGLADREALRRALAAATVKSRDDRPAFDALFPLYFGSGGPPLQNALEDLAEDERELVQAALEALTGRLKRLLDWLSSGEGPSREQLEEMAPIAPATPDRPAGSRARCCARWASASSSASWTNWVSNWPKPA